MTLTSRSSGCATSADGTCRVALISAGFRIEHSEAGLYVGHATNPAGTALPGWPSAALVAPFYGSAGDRFIQVALTATDERRRRRRGATSGSRALGSSA